MTLRTFTYGVDNVTASITKEDKQNIDVMTLKVPFTTTADIGDEVKFNDENNDLAFAGYIERKNTTGELTLYCEDYGSVLKRLTTNQIYVNQLPEEIIEDVVTNAGLTYVSTIVTTVTIPTYTANKKNSEEIVRELADRLFANYSTDVNKNFRLEIEGGTISSKSISISTATLDGSWEQETTEIVNSVYVEGDSRSVFQKEESFNGTGAQTEFTLAEIPINIRVEHPVGTLKTGYVDGQSTGDYQIKRDEKKLIFDVAPSSGTNNILVTYDYSIPVSIRRRNKASIDTYGERTRIVRKNFITTRDDAVAYANYLINNFSQPLVNSTWIINNQADIIDWQNYKPNDSMFVNDTLTGFSDYYIIRKVERKYGRGVSLKITVGSRESNIALWDKEVADRIRQLEQRDDNNTILNEDELVTENLKISFSTEVVYIKTKSKGDAWILDDATNSQLDSTFKLDGGTLVQIYP